MSDPDDRRLAETPTQMMKYRILCHRVHSTEAVIQQKERPRPEERPCQGQSLPLAAG